MKGGHGQGDKAGQAKGGSPLWGSEEAESESQSLCPKSLKE